MKKMTFNSIKAYIRNNIFGLIICALWWFPVTYFGYWTSPVGTSWFSMLKFPVLSVAVLLLLKSGFNKINWMILCFLLIAFSASFYSVDVVYSLAKFAGLAVVISLMSSLFRSRRGRELREKIWNNLCWSAVAVSMLSVFWTICRLPAPQIYFKMGFSGITSHAMLFGPVAGIATVFLLSKALAEKKMVFFIMSAVSFMACFTSLSRSAAAATALGVFAVITVSLIARNKATVARFMLPIVLILAFIVSYIPNDQLPLGLGGGEMSLIGVKGLENSRESYWQERWDEFEEKPLLGFGIGMSSRYEEAKEFSEGRFEGTVEPGSSYLVVLSMTGALGAISLISVIMSEVLKLKRVWTKIPMRRRFEIAGVGLFLFVHAGAEGWIYSPGGVMCLFFWIWLGITGDAYDRILYGNQEVTHG
ncbi:MAG: O-antigen ligase family protein [Candidatus Berkelbacteria bacterium]|nr:O-antigen ligase family protein [Candidatus Berkelbacteria bacterium]